MSFLRVQNISKSFGELKVLQNLSFELESGKIYSIMGANGSGKTTIFNAIRFVLFGYSKTDLDLLIRDSADKCKVSFEFESDKIIYKIERVRSKKAGGAGLFLFRKEKDLWVDLTQRCNGFLDYLNYNPQDMIDTLNYWIGTDC